MNYGYCPTANDKKLLADLSSELRLPIGPAGDGPYLELNGLYPGVRIRGITGLTDQEIDRLVEQADLIHRNNT